jgi:hypothetical protein
MLLFKPKLTTPLDRLCDSLIFLLLLGIFGQMAAANVPWQRQYKIKPNQTARLTPADVVGPDGLVYPNWTKCGVQGGVSNAKVMLSVEDFGAKSDDDADDSDALAKACEAAGKRGGGAILLSEGTYYLDSTRP